MIGLSCAPIQSQWTQKKDTHSLYHPQTKFGGYIGITLSVCLSVCSSVQRKLNLGNNFWTESDRAFILRTCIPCGETFLLVPKFLIPWPWPPTLTYFWKNFNLSNNFWTESDRAFILRTCISCGEPFLSVPKFLIPWPWPPTLTYFWKNLTLTISFELKAIGLSYYAPVFPVVRPFCQYQNFWSHDLDLQLWPTFEKTEPWQ